MILLRQKMMSTKLYKFHHKNDIIIWWMKSWFWKIMKKLKSKYIQVDDRIVKLSIKIYEKNAQTLSNLWSKKFNNFNHIIRCSFITICQQIEKKIDVFIDFVSSTYFVIILFFILLFRVYFVFVEYWYFENDLIRIVSLNSNCFRMRLCFFIRRILICNQINTINIELS